MCKQLLLKIAVASTILGLQSCQTIDAVIAQGSGELTFKTENQWEYAGEVAPIELSQQVKEENINDSWLGDPRRFSMIKVQYMGQKYPLYLVEPGIRCERDRCPREIHRPLCGVAARCSYFVYIEKDGEYRKVWGKLFQRQGDTPLFKVSRQMKDGVPACLEMGGIDAETWLNDRPQKGEDEIFRSRYCFNGKEYVLTQLDRIPENSVKTP
ncbi:hypothetical protein [Crocosphaera sp. Alani8]|uniref:hypothetical protein n=1 Tax=Crocosphaera sp. Alani8 TaxID=3038952 RepID=UPI00313B0939